MLEWVQDLAPYGIFCTDTSLQIVTWNRWLAERSGFRAEEIIGKVLTDAFPEVVQRRLADIYRRALTGEVYVLSAALHKYLLALPTYDRAPGRGQMLQTARVAPLRMEGRIVGTITWIEDVTQRELHARALRRQQGMDRLLSHTLGVLLQSSQPARDLGPLLKRVAPELRVDAFLHYELALERPALRLAASSGLHPRQREGLQEIVLKDPAAPGRTPGDFLRETLDRHLGDLRDAGLRAVAAYPMVVGETILGLLAFGSYDRDDYDEESRSVLARISRYATLAVDRAIREQKTVAASKAKDHFLAALSHELRAPLNPVLLVASDAARNKAFPPEAREAFRNIERSALLEARLIDDLLDLTRIEHDKIKLDLGEVELHALLRDAGATIAPDFAERSLTVEWRLEARRTTVLADLVRLQQVFWNILKNAAKFTPAGGHVRILTQDDPAGNHVVVEITDSGIGMEAEELARIFEAFSQGEHGGRGYGGLGLGLAISRKLVSLHQGRISATSEGRNRGSTFRIQLPVLSDRRTGSPDAGEPAEARPRSPSNANVASAAVLLVEDHEPTRLPLERMLTRRGFSVTSVASASDAIKAATSQKFDVVLSDIGLPDASGLDLMNVLRRDFGLSGIALTGYGMEEDLVRSAAAGFVSHLTKPIRIDALEQALRSVLPLARDPS